MKYCRRRPTAAVMKSYVSIASKRFLHGGNKTLLRYLNSLTVPQSYKRIFSRYADSHSRTPRNSISTKLNLWNFLLVRAQSHATKRYLSVDRPQMTRVERIGPVLFHAACGCVAANHSSDNSRFGFLAKWRDELTCIKDEKSSRTIS